MLQEYCKGNQQHVGARAGGRIQVSLAAKKELDPIAVFLAHLIQSPGKLFDRFGDHAWCRPEGSQSLARSVFEKTLEYLARLDEVFRHFTGESYDDSIASGWSPS